jgi:ArsR family transcriptional regulator
MRGALVDSLKYLSKIAGALSDPGRAKVVLALKGRSLCVCHIVEMLGLSFPTVSRHLSILEAAGLIVMEKRGKWTYCSLPGRDGDPAALSAIRWLQAAAASLDGDAIELHGDAGSKNCQMSSKPRIRVKS